ncbi:hypothetical protein N7533_005169 [Penicillium manginii]|uniref:uncharacterized protein n=1 Tax=Penicillium manginii TaxID=203109 RepID=UPI002549758F|nr:uncharacterized protein N7533_005169 [Penicillium manginii]KAJ5755626.1 hypothetical protein N7533_005169 [Penicillium manginii]
MFLPVVVLYLLHSLGTDEISPGVANLMKYGRMIVKGVSRLLEPALGILICLIAGLVDDKVTVDLRLLVSPTELIIGLSKGILGDVPFSPQRGILLIPLLSCALIPLALHVEEGVLPCLEVTPVFGLEL